MQGIDWSGAIEYAATKLFLVWLAVIAVAVSRQVVRMRIAAAGFRWRDVAIAVLLLAGVVWWQMTRDGSLPCADRDPVSGSCFEYGEFEPDTRTPTQRAGDALVLLLLLGGGAAVGFGQGFGRKSPAAEREYAAAAEVLQSNGFAPTPENIRKFLRAPGNRKRLASLNAQTTVQTVPVGPPR